MEGLIYPTFKNLFFVFKTCISMSTIWVRNPKRKGMSMLQSIKRGDIFYADLSPVVGSEQGGLRPVLIVQNDVGNKYSPTVIAAAITSRLCKTRLPTHIDIHADRVGLAKDSVILLEQIRTLDKKRLKERMGHLDDDVMDRVDLAIAVSFGLGERKYVNDHKSRGAAVAGIENTPQMSNSDGGGEMMS